MAASADPLADGRELVIDDALDGLHRMLIAEPGRGVVTGWRAPLALFRDHHDGGAAGAEFSALLLCTDERWWKAAGRLVRALAGTGLLDDDALDALADTFLHSDRVTVTVLASWAGLRFDFEPELQTQLLAAGGAVETQDGSVDPLIPYRRAVHAPLRRWAAERLLRREQVQPAAVLDRAGQLEDTHRAAVTSGLLDACDDLPAAEVDRAVAVGLASSHSQVRRTALEVLRDRGEVERAHRRALADPAKAVRDWARRLPGGSRQQ